MWKVSQGKYQKNVVILNEWIISTLCRIQLWLLHERDALLCRTAPYKPLGASACCFPLEKAAVQISAARLFLRQTDMLLVFSASAAITLCKVLSAFPGGEGISVRSISPTFVLVCRSSMVWITSKENLPQWLSFASVIVSDFYIRSVHASVSQSFAGLDTLPNWS